MYFSNSHASRDLPMPGTPTIDSSRCAPLGGGRVKELLGHAQLALAADEQRLEPAEAAFSLPRRDDPECLPQRRLPALAFELVLPGVRVRPYASVARFVASPTSTVPGSAADWTRDAVLTRSPATMPWSHAPIVTAASPVSTPARASSAGWRARHRCDELERGAHCPLGVVLARDRGAPDGHDRVADELLDRSSVALDDRLRLLEVEREELAGLLGIAILGGGREADEIREENRHQPSLRSGRRGLGAAVT